MKILKNIDCGNCIKKCDIYLTAKEMHLEHEIKAVHAVYKKHEDICRQNTTVTHAISLIEGNAKIYIDGINNRNIILNILLPSNYIGLMAIFGLQKYLYNVSCLNECHTCQVEMRLVKKMYLNNQNFQLKLNQAFADSVSNILEKLISLNQKQVRGKVAESLLYISQLFDSKEFMLPLTRKELGELSAVSEENAVRILAEFNNDDIIDMKGKEILIKDMETLRKISIIG